jgi:putative membrane protein
LQSADDGLRIEFGMFTRVSSLVPVHRIQLLTVSASLLHRWFGRAGIDVETAGAIETGGSDLGNQLAASGAKSNRQWLAPVIERGRAPALVRQVMPEIEFDAVEWVPIDARATTRLLKKSVLVVAIPTAVIMATLSFTPIPASGFHALWLPGVALPVLYVGAVRWVRNAGYALTDSAVYFRSGWLSRKMTAVRLDKVQTVAMNESPFDRRYRMASVAVDTAGAGSVGHRIDIPYLDVEVARGIFSRLYTAACATEFRW